MRAAPGLDQCAAGAGEFGTETISARPHEQAARKAAAGRQRESKGACAAGIDRAVLEEQAVINTVQRAERIRNEVGRDEGVGDELERQDGRVGIDLAAQSDGGPVLKDPTPGGCGGQGVTIAQNHLARLKLRGDAAVAVDRNVQ